MATGGFALTCHVTFFHNRPPLPYDPVASSVRLEHAVNVEGTMIETMGNNKVRGRLDTTTVFIFGAKEMQA